MSRLIIFGAGGHGRVVADAARRGGGWGEIVFADDRHGNIATVAGLAVIGSFARMLEGMDSGDAAALGLGDNAQRVALARKLKDRGIAVPVIVHPDATVSDTAQVEDGTVILARAVVQTGARIGRAAIINTGAIVEHDCRIGAGVHLSPGVSLGGKTEVGDATWIGIGAAVVNDLRIGKNVIVGAGAAVTADVPDGVTVVGVPARVLDRA